MDQVKSLVSIAAASVSIRSRHAVDKAIADVKLALEDVPAASNHGTDAAWQATALASMLDGLPVAKVPAAKLHRAAWLKDRLVGDPTFKVCAPEAWDAWRLAWAGLSEEAKNNFEAQVASLEAIVDFARPLAKASGEAIDLVDPLALAPLGI